ncbi:MAG: hypothetical protein JOZ81_12135 [Chloroflexi bacterium]|nr:hypothetical protein [Chloroflexota bacterium]MBV9546328.1 hypothetical protein [Chloroflexota bacterium]
MHSLRFPTRFLVVGMVVVLLGTLAGPAQARDERVTFTKWFSPGFPNMLGFVDDEPVGSFNGQVLDLVPTPDNRFILLEAQYNVTSGNPSRSFSAVIAGEQSVQSGKAVLTGSVVSGPRTGEPVNVQFTQRTDCPGAPKGVCFQGTIRIGDAATEND